MGVAHRGQDGQRSDPPPARPRHFSAPRGVGLEGLPRRSRGLALRRGRKQQDASRRGEQPYGRVRSMATCWRRAGDVLLYSFWGREEIYGGGWNAAGAYVYVRLS